MKIFILFTIIIIATLFIGKKFINSAKRNLFKDQATWSGKDLKIKYIKSKEVKDLKESENYLKIIADESKLYLDDQAINKGE